MASVQARTNRDGSVTHRLMYYVQRKLRSISFTDANEAKHWAHVFDVLGPDAGKRALQEALGQVAPPPPEPTIEEMVLRHIELLTGIQAGTRADYVTHAHRDIVPLIGDVRRSEITKPSGLSGSTSWRIEACRARRSRTGTVCCRPRSRPRPSRRGT